MIRVSPSPSPSPSPSLALERAGLSAMTLSRRGPVGGLGHVGAVEGGWPPKPTVRWRRRPSLCRRRGVWQPHLRARRRQPRGRTGRERDRYDGSSCGERPRGGRPGARCGPDREAHGPCGSTDPRRIHPSPERDHGTTAPPLSDRAASAADRDPRPPGSVGGDGGTSSGQPTPPGTFRRQAAGPRRSRALPSGRRDQLLRRSPGSTGVGCARGTRAIVLARP